MGGKSLVEAILVVVQFFGNVPRFPFYRIAAGVAFLLLDQGRLGISDNIWKKEELL